MCPYGEQKKYFERQVVNKTRYYNKNMLINCYKNYIMEKLAQDIF